MGNFCGIMGLSLVTNRTHVGKKAIICVIGMSLTKMAAGKKANGSSLQLQGLESSDLPSAQLLASVTEQEFSRFALATYNDIHD